MNRLRALLVFVLLLGSACAIEEQGPEAAPTPATPCLPPSCVEFFIDGLDYAFNPPTITARAGTVRFVLRNVGQKVHNLKIQGGAVEARTPNLAPGATGFVDVVLEPRRYDIFCTIAGHAERGMRGTLIVTP
ncbi:MAG: cupredoxin domain-containing protein [Chloroflexota bacterium]|nr:cupredoxin domain-containing protein [Dehalococcoidia bacterium]MDW8253590.1 cupredoxin domain-containing protein [Chloroflexota bacterium]